MGTVFFEGGIRGGLGGTIGFSAQALGNARIRVVSLSGPPLSITATLLAGRESRRGDRSSYAATVGGSERETRYL